MRYAILAGAVLGAALVGCGETPSGLEPEAALFARSAADCVNVRGVIIDAEFVSATEIEGTIVDQTLGAGDAFATVTELIPAGAGALHVRLEHRYEWPTGEVLLTEDQGILSPIDPPLYRFNNRLEVVGGEGPFDGAHGAVNAHGTAVVELGGAIDLEYHGRICT